MTYRVARAAIGLVAVFFVCPGCDDSRALVGPTRTPISLVGVVTDTAFRSLGGARVEVVGGPRAGTIVTTDEEGRFSLPGTFIDVTTLVASKEGYRAQTQTISPGTFRAPAWEGRAWVAFYLDLPDPGPDIAGDYSLTLTADTACTNLPDEARMRNYRATLVAGNRPGLFLGDLGDARFFGDSASFSIGTAGDYAGFPFAIMEALGGTTYLLIDGFGRGSIDSSGITASLEGVVVYCPAEPTLVDQGTWWCTDPAQAQCRSGSHRLTLVRR